MNLLPLILRYFPLERAGLWRNGDSINSAPNWHLGWLSLDDCKVFLENSEVNLSEDSLVYLGSKSEKDVVYWAIDVSEVDSLVNELGSRQLCFVKLRTLMIATDWSDDGAMGDLAVAGHSSGTHQLNNLLDEKLRKTRVQLMNLA
ncbi:hypothetical protein LOK49_LG13G00246 [Camellia lanceoleosa]|uniref:Uncharacterized protein n=1 Tax=Camellia lanceoleosa TaxID=1840588 RepID=A0ACC0FIY0_9ERIC|nr:hypothetical protein LOK49_LG13G00246 [Camellia lanceoleosa]